MACLAARHSGTIAHIDDQHMFRGMASAPGPTDASDPLSQAPRPKHLRLHVLHAVDRFETFEALQCGRDRPLGCADPRLERGRYLVEGPGHCGECHTPRNRLGAPDRSAWLAGAPSLEGEGRVPAITAEALADWSTGDLAYYLESGIDPEFDVVGGSMAKVQENLARLPSEDRAAIAAYLKQVGVAR